MTFRNIIVDSTSRLFDITSYSEDTLFKYLMGTLVAISIAAKSWPYMKSYTDRRIVGNSNSNSSNSSSSSSNHDNIIDGSNKSRKSTEILALQQQFLPIFFLFRMGFWMNGPYFYQAYLSKILSNDNGTTTSATPEFVARVFLVGYLSIVLFSPITGRLTDKYGPKIATIVAGIMYAFSSLSIISNNPWMLYLGRAIGSIASCTLCSAPESWLVGEYLRIETQKLQEQQQQQKQSKKNENEKHKNGTNSKQQTKTKEDDYLSQTFELAYGGDALVAILAGQTASLAATHTGNPTGPFLLSPLFITPAILLTTLFWVERKGGRECENGSSDIEDDDTIERNDEGQNLEGKKTKDKSPVATDCCHQESGLEIIFSDPKIILIGLVQSLFEGSMYIFVLVWPPAISNSIRQGFGPAAVTPFGTVFSCFMASCLLGSILFGQCRCSLVDVKSIMVTMLFISTIAFSVSVFAIQKESLPAIIFAFLIFEVCVGVYFPSMGTIRSQLLPESHRPVIMSLFAVPLNILVLGVIFFHPKIGDIGALTIASFAMGTAACCMVLLRWKIRCEDEVERQRSLKARNTWRQIITAKKFAQKLQRSITDPIKSLEESAKSVQYRHGRNTTCNNGAVC